MDYPQYVVYQDSKRTCFPKALKIFGLCIIFLFGIWLNLHLLKIGEQTRNLVLAISFFAVIILAAVEVLICWKKTKRQKYEFYKDRIKFKNERAYYSGIRNIVLKQNVLDKIFNTSAISIAPYFKIKNIKNAENIVNYINQLIRWARTNNPLA